MRSLMILQLERLRPSIQQLKLQKRPSLRILKPAGRLVRLASAIGIGARLAQATKLAGRHPNLTRGEIGVQKLTTDADNDLKESSKGCFMLEAREREINFEADNKRGQAFKFRSL